MHDYDNLTESNFDEDQFDEDEILDLVDLVYEGLKKSNISVEAVTKRLKQNNFDVRKTIQAFNQKPQNNKPKEQKEQKIPASSSSLLTSSESTRNSNTDGFTKPQPEDTSKSKSKKTSKAPASLTESIKSLNIDKKQPNAKPPAENARSSMKLKPIELLISDYKASQHRSIPLSFVIMGHVDSGKSTLIGRLMYDCGYVDERKMRKFQKESQSIGKSSFAWAWVMDTTEEERNRGVTADVSTTFLEIEKQMYCLLDSPGHKDFVSNMIAGTSLADFALLVVDSSTNNFESGFCADGQTKEHIVIARSFGISNLVVAVNKMDTHNWSFERFSEITSILNVFLLSSGFKPENITYIPISGYQGQNMLTPYETVKSWPQEERPQCLAEALKKITVSENADLYKEPFRFLVFDTVKSPAITQVVGRIESGVIQQGQKVICSQTNQVSTVKSITIESTQVDYAVSKEIVRLNLTLADVETDEINAGDLLCDLENIVPLKTKIRTRILTFQMSKPMLKGSEALFHRHRSCVPVQVTDIFSIQDKQTGQMKSLKPRFLQSNSTAIVEITFNERPVPLVTYKENKALGRFLLRRDGATLAAGIVEE